MRDSVKDKNINIHTDATNTKVNAIETRVQKQKSKVIKPILYLILYKMLVMNRLASSKYLTILFAIMTQGKYGGSQ